MAIETDVLVIGCGISGAAAALRLAQDRGRQVTVITRAGEPQESNTRYAQGGIVARGVDDSPDLLVEDVLRAGAGLSLPAPTHLLAEEGPSLVERILIEDVGVDFDRAPNGELAYTREGGHSVPRVLHVGDATGRAIEEALIERLRQSPNVSLHTGLTAVDLITSPHHSHDPLAIYQPITCHGVYALSQDGVHRILAPATVLATGGVGRIYRHTTNPPGARGDGLAMASRAGARVINAEYVQFHPTTLAIPGADNFLISEAVRGEGARLYTLDGRHFMDDYAPKWGDLAPRDVVSRAIQNEMLEHGYPHVLLDLAPVIQKRGAEHVRQRFPTIYATCLEAGVDISAEPVPVVPAAHYFCGGVLVDAWGRSTIEGLYAVGEVSCTGVHGANRLASTSLLEGLIWGDRAGRDIGIRDDLALVDEADIPPWQQVGDTLADPILVYRDSRTIQNIMWLYGGLARNTHRLARALKDLNHLWQVIDDFYRTTRLSDELIGLRNMAQTAWIITRAAWHNRQSRGTHYRQDAEDTHFAGLHDTEGPLPNSVSEF